jgi:hypothetical protein
MMKIRGSTKTELEKVAGEVQSIQGGNVSLSGAVDFLITFYRDNKALVDGLWGIYMKMPVPKDYATKDEYESALLTWTLNMEAKFRELRPKKKEAQA